MSLDLSSALVTFAEEARDLLATMEDALLSFDLDEPDDDSINLIFRAAHTIKGSSGLFGFSAIVAFTHVVENLLDRIRNNQVAMDADLVSVLLKCKDHIQLLVDVVVDGDEIDAQAIGSGETLLSSLQRWQDTPVISQASSNSTVDVVDNGNASGSDCWHISLRFGGEVLRNGMDPLSFIRYLATLGTIIHVSILDDALPDAESMDAEVSYLGFEIDLKSDATRTTIDAVFDFVREDSKIRIIAPNANVQEYLNLVDELPEDNIRIGEILVKSGALTDKELNHALSIQQKQKATAGSQENPLGQILIEESGVSAGVINAALKKQKTTVEKKAASETKFIKVEASRLDPLINIIGELVTYGAAANIKTLNTHDRDAIEAVLKLSQLVNQIRDIALGLRMVQVGETFQRFRRVVRDVSAELGKNIDLVILGAETELDKSMIDKLADPLMHIVRNAMDHGIETPDIRQYSGKPAMATLTLNAYHAAGSVVIEISEDGAGMKKDLLLAKAIERGLISADQKLTESEIFNLIFLPGFSTAAAITNLSGRGVGMDVVKRNIEDLRGEIEIESVAGQGTLIRFRLPLTLAIIDGFHVESAAASFILPLSLVVECVDFDGAVQAEGRQCINLRGELLPLIRLSDIFELENKQVCREKVVVVEFAEWRAGIVVDKLCGELNAVVKPMGQIFKALKGIGGSTILGTGDVALIVDVPQLLQFAATHENAEAKPQPKKRKAKTKVNKA